MKKIDLHIHIDNTLAEKLETLAKKNFRTISGQLEYLIDREANSESQLSFCLDGSSAFSYNSDGTLSPIRLDDSLALEQLYLYNRERKLALDNTLAFIKGLPAQNTLLFGDKGTGKSATIRSIAHQCRDSILKIIEVKKTQIINLSKLISIITEHGGDYKFILFFDDLSLSGDSDEYSELKSALDGSLSRNSNILIYATSNRRNIVKENASDRDNAVFVSDTLQEHISLSERFGLTINFMRPGKNEFYVILMGILNDRGIAYDENTLKMRAEQFATNRGGRSCRVAKQLADIIECEQSAD